MDKQDQMKQIFVYADWEQFSIPKLMGILSSHRIRGKEVFQFEYDKEWLESSFVQMIDPDLQLYVGPQYLQDNKKSNFGIFLDSSPDRWGRILMTRREAALAKVENRSPKRLFETDYLLGVYDKHRMGAIRFKESNDGPFLNDNIKFAAPPWSSIRELEEISIKIEEDKIVDDPNYLDWLRMLVAPGSSLGGARPKASIIDENNHPWIAKFPSKNDSYDIGAWEMVVNILAHKAGINMAEGMAQKFSTRHHTYLSKRFDRSLTGRRIHFASAMTLLGYTDGNNHEDGVSYLELVEFISNYGVRIKEDLEELWRRIVFNICISNTDDHLRNHGFILTSKGWQLSPAYDINPVPNSYGLSLNISEDDNALDLELVKEVAPFFRISQSQCDKIIDEIKSSVSTWREIANKYNISKSEQEVMKTAFINAEG
ncbi:HipA domain-containing protein [Halosquirtibacter xylanolyticus]|uniref:type II toxin-antitoxin system HipA family toxin n=1 Tax=Halosquirtibacter xylanolyticus TaxID=3374599 RepID=UPI003749F94B|nr:HipA domain-containing protein [Prolixibacteraceae bacterium]